MRQPQTGGIAGHHGLLQSASALCKAASPSATCRTSSVFRSASAEQRRVCLSGGDLDRQPLQLGLQLIGPAAALMSPPSRQRSRTRKGFLLPPVGAGELILRCAARIWRERCQLRLDACQEGLTSASSGGGRGCSSRARAAARRHRRRSLRLARLTSARPHRGRGEHRRRRDGPPLLALLHPALDDEQRSTTPGKGGDERRRRSRFDPPGCAESACRSRSALCSGTE
jgi:hypothetical protein